MGKKQKKLDQKADELYREYKRVQGDLRHNRSYGNNTGENIARVTADSLDSEYQRMTGESASTRSSEDYRSNRYGTEQYLKNNGYRNND